MIHLKAKDVSFDPDFPQPQFLWWVRNVRGETITCLKLNVGDADSNIATGEAHCLNVPHWIKVFSDWLRKTHAMTLSLHCKETNMLVYINKKLGA